ncbi:MAG: branched-chain amino acid ABC transporter substrate-binding protein [Sterolibacterium sp.]|jgi:branched-chain amino acid transport system substrate-binding protein|nr:branched-chain amino acid ABC transporter substrate-binding protein [Sterolibacterium sp.]
MNLPFFRSPWGCAALLSILSVLLLSACGKQPAAPQTAAAQTPPADVTLIRIGQASPLTGGGAHLGKDNEYGVRLALEQANAQEIRIGGHKVQFELQSEDDQSDPKVGTTVAQKLIDAKVAGVVGHLNSGTTVPASALYEQAGVPMISGSATNPQLTEQGFRHVFRIVGRDDQQGPAVAHYLLTEVKPKRVAIIDDATAYGAGLANEVEKALKAAGVQVLPREQGTNKTTDWKAILTKLKGKQPDAVFYGGMDDTAGPLIKQARELGLNVPFSFGDGGCTDKMVELAGSAIEGMYCSQAGIPVQAANPAFLAAYQTRFKSEPLLYGPFTYDAANLLIAAMKQADSSDPAKYLPALAQIKYDGATGHIEFDAKGDRKAAEMTIFTARAGKITPLAIIKSGQLIRYEDFIAHGGAAAR